MTCHERCCSLQSSYGYPAVTFLTTSKILMHRGKPYLVMQFGTGDVRIWRLKWAVHTEQPQIWWWLFNFDDSDADADPLDASSSTINVCGCLLTSSILQLISELLHYRILNHLWLEIIMACIVSGHFLALHRALACCMFEKWWNSQENFHLKYFETNLNNQANSGCDNVVKCYLIQLLSEGPLCNKNIHSQAIMSTRQMSAVPLILPSEF